LQLSKSRLHTTEDRRNMMALEATRSIRPEPDFQQSTSRGTAMGAITNAADFGQAKDWFTRPLSRRSAIGLLALSGAMVVAGRGQAMPNDRVPQSLRFLAFVDGSRSGTQNIDFVPRNGGFTAMSSLSIRMELLFVTLYRFQQSGEEDWPVRKTGKTASWSPSNTSPTAMAYVPRRGEARRERQLPGDRPDRSTNRSRRCNRRQLLE
jgi:hypothetical protein